MLIATCALVRGAKQPGCSDKPASGPGREVLGLCIADMDCTWKEPNTEQSCHKDAVILVKEALQQKLMHRNLENETDS